MCLSPQTLSSSHSAADSWFHEDPAQCHRKLPYLCDQLTFWPDAFGSAADPVLPHMPLRQSMLSISAEIGLKSWRSRFPTLGPRTKPGRHAAKHAIMEPFISVMVAVAKGRQIQHSHVLCCCFYQANRAVPLAHLVGNIAGRLSALVCCI